MGCLFSAWKTINGATGRFSLLQFPYIGGPHRPARPFLGAGPARFRPPQTPGRPPFSGLAFPKKQPAGRPFGGLARPPFPDDLSFPTPGRPRYPTGSPRRPRPHIRRPPRAGPRFLEPWPGRPRKRALSQTTPFMTKSGNTRNAFWTMRRRFPRTSLDALR